MEIYTLDTNLNEQYVVEGYKSLIWTERYSAYGDFQIVINSTPANRDLLAVETLLSQADSDYVMKVTTITDSTAQDGSDTLTVTGKSLESVLDDRVAMPPESISHFMDNPKWVLTGAPGDIARALFQRICVDLALDPGDSIPFYVPGILLPHGSIPEPTEVVTVTLDPDSLYNSVKKVCDTYGLGFRIVRARGLAQLYFEIYTGDDHTSAQKVNVPVIFGPDLDNLANPTRLISTADYKTIAYVFGKDEVKIVYGVGANTTPTGLDRKVIVVSATSIDATNVVDVDAALSQKGLEALAAHQKIYQFDGEISQYGQFQYGRDYRLGDLVEERDSTGYGNQMRVTEQIFVSDGQGDRSYPTLSLTLTLVPGTWSEVTTGEDWKDEATDEFWGNQ